MVSPDARVAIGLQLHAHGSPVGFGPGLTCSADVFLDLVKSPSELLHMVADLVCDHIGPGEIARGPGTAFASPRRSEVDVASHRPRQVKRNHRRLRPRHMSTHRRRHRGPRRGPILTRGTAGISCYQTSSVLPSTFETNCPISSVGAPFGYVPRFALRGNVLGDVHHRTRGQNRGSRRQGQLRCPPRPARPRPCRSHGGPRHCRSPAGPLVPWLPPLFPVEGSSTTVITGTTVRDCDPLHVLTQPEEREDRHKRQQLRQ